METTSILNLLKQDAQIGDVINLYLTTGNSVRGTILEIGETFLLMEVEGVKRRYFPQLMGGWDVVKDNPLSGNLQKTDEQSADVGEQNDEETNEDDYNDILISLFDNIYECEHITLSAIINTNASVVKVSPTGVSVIADSGETFVCHKGFMVGFSRANCTPGKRLFCGTINNSGPQKGVCFQSILQMSFEEMRERFIIAISSKPAPRKPIINSVISYFRKNYSGKPTKKIIADIRTKLNLLGNTGKAGNTQLDKYISFKQYGKAFDLIEREISSSEDEKQKSALLLRKAQLYSSLKDHENAISAYRELISFNESINSPSKNLSHLYTELARLLFLTRDIEQAESARSIALMLNPQNSIAKKIGGLDNSKGNNDENTLENVKTLPQEDEQNCQTVKFTDKSLIDDDIDKHAFTDSEIVSLNGEVTNEIATRLLESASASEDYNRHIEAAKALKNLPIGSYDIQDLEDTITNYSICKCNSLFNSYKKVVFESDSLKSISIEQLNRIKDCAICYSLETIENILDEDEDTATKLLLNCLLLELSSIYVTQKKSKVSVLDVLAFSLDGLITFVMSYKESLLVANLFVKLVNYSLQCRNLWEKLILKSNQFVTFVSYIQDSKVIKQDIINITPPLKKRDVNDINYVDILRRHESNRIKVSIQQLRKIKNTDFDISSITLLQKRISSIVGEKRLRFFSDTDRKSLVNIQHLISLLSLYQKKNEDERKDIIANVFLVIDEMLRWNSGETATKIGRFYFYPLLSSWKESISRLNAKEEYKDSCLLTLEMDSPYYIANGDSSKSITAIVYNNSNLISEGYKLAIWIGDNRKDSIFKSDDRYILPNSNVPVSILIPQEKWGELKTYELNFAVSSRYQGKWSNAEFLSATITSKRDISFKKGEQKWRDSGNPPVEMFKGRDGIVNELKEQYCSQNRRYSYVLYGLSRTGKSTILHYLKRAIEGVEIEGTNSTKVVLPLFVDLGDIYGNVNSSEKFWKLFIKNIYNDTTDFIKKYKPGINIEKPEDFSQYIMDMDKLNIHPLFMLDEFSFMQDIINKGYINSAFLQYMRTISADKDQASFLFAGTYDIKKLIHDSKYNISGAFNLSSG